MLQSAEGNSTLTRICDKISVGAKNVDETVTLTTVILEEAAKVRLSADEENACLKLNNTNYKHLTFAHMQIGQQS